MSAERPLARANIAFFGGSSGIGRAAAINGRGQPVTISASCVGSTRTKAMSDPLMPLSMRFMGALGARPEISAQNAVRLLTCESAQDANGGVLRVRPVLGSGTRSPKV
jgi:hypothetical protein